VLTSPPHFSASNDAHPQLYVLVESGHHAAPPAVTSAGWSCVHLPGAPPTNDARQSGGGISLLHHDDCPVRLLPDHSCRVPASLSLNSPPSSAVLCALVQPRHCQPFLLAAVYLQPVVGDLPDARQRLTELTQRIELARAAHPQLPLLVVGDFNCRHELWNCPPDVSRHDPLSDDLVDWLDDQRLDVINTAGSPTRVAGSSGASGVSAAVLDLVLCSHPGMVRLLTQEPAALQTDHVPFTIGLDLAPRAAAPRAANARPRRSWNQHQNAGAWQAALPYALTDALQPLQPQLARLAQPLPVGTSAQALLDDVYAQVEQALLDTCLREVGTKLVSPSSKPWMRYPGVRDAYDERRAALLDYRLHPHDAAAHARLRAARRAWATVSAEAKLQSYSDLCDQAMQRDDRLRWAAFKRSGPSALSSLASICDPVTGALPADHDTALDHLCSAFLANGVPPPAADAAAYAATCQRVAHWAAPLPAAAADAPASDAWTWTAAQVKQQCCSQPTNSAPGPDALLPVFLAHAGDAAYAALASLYTFSWQHGVLPQAWREANVMALYKGDGGDKADASSYRPISMTSIVIRTFEHLVHERLSAELEQRGFFADTQYGFRKGRSPLDAIHTLLSSLQRRMRDTATDGMKQQCPVLFLDLVKAFDRVDHAILLQRVHDDAGITGRAWRWLRAFLSARRMRCVDASHTSAWQPSPHGVPQGCVLSPLLFLIFINGLQNTISNDMDCRLVSPLFFADDGAIAPNPRCDASSALFEAGYSTALQCAIDHLNTWCGASRMRFGAKKTQLVVFTTRQQPRTDSYAHLQLCGFTIQLAPTSSYLYLGLHLQRDLSWTTHHREVLRRAALASARVTRVALRARDASVAVVRSLVLGYLIPSFDYGILFWGRDPDLLYTTRRSLEGHIARPLRAALQLPRTTHLHGVLTLTHTPTVAALALRAQLSFLRRVCSGELPAGHPTADLHKSAVVASRANGRPRQPYNTMAASSTTRLSVYLLSSVYPRVVHDPALRSYYTAEAAAQLANGQQLLPHWDDGVQYWLHQGADRRAHARAGAADAYTQQRFEKALDWSLQGAAQLTPALIRTVCSAHAHAEWVARHNPPPPTVLTAPIHMPAQQRATTAPLTQCKPTPGLPHFLHHRSPCSLRERVARARLLMGRARTGAVLRRYARADERAAVNPYCTHAACQPPPQPAPAPEPPLDTIEHMLLHCLRHTASRAALEADLLSRGQLALTLPNILLAHPPPRVQRHQLGPLLSVTARYLRDVEAQRTNAGLVPLDTG